MFRGLLLLIAFSGLLYSCFLSDDEKKQVEPNRSSYTTPSSRSSNTTSQVTTQERQALHNLIIGRGYPCSRLLSAHGPVGGTRYHVACGDNSGSGSVYLVEDLGNNYWAVNRKY